MNAAYERVADVAKSNRPRQNALANNECKMNDDANLFDHAHDSKLSTHGLAAASGCSHQDVVV